jgi:hypothetical protein
MKNRDLLRPYCWTRPATAAGGTAPKSVSFLSIRSFCASSELPNVHWIPSTFAGRCSDFQGSFALFQFGFRTARAVRPFTHCFR